MISLKKLCAEMNMSGRHLTKRAARDWWTKGLLPKPSRRSYGRAGFETYWPNNNVIAQATATYDLLQRYSRADATLVRLWLMGFRINIDRLRPAWLELIAKDELPVSRAEERGQLREDVIGDMVTSVARSMTRDRSDVYDNLSAVISESFNVFFGISEEIEGYGLATAVKNAMIHLHPELPAAHHSTWSDEDCVWALELLKRWCSLPVQREMITGASKHEFTRARRLLQIGFGTFGRRRENLKAGNHWPFVIVFGRSAIPVLIKLLRQPYACDVIDNALQISRKMRRKRGDVVHAFYQSGSALSSEIANHSAG